MNKPVAVTVSLPQPLFDAVVRVARARGLTVGQVIVTTLEQSLGSDCDEYDCPGYPLGPGPAWIDHHLRNFGP